MNDHGVRRCFALKGKQDITNINIFGSDRVDRVTDLKIKGPKFLLVPLFDLLTGLTGPRRHASLHDFRLFEKKSMLKTFVPWFREAFEKKLYNQ